MDIKPATIYRDKSALLAAGTLGASFMPFCDYGGINVSLAGIHGFIDQLQQVLDNAGGLDILLLLYLIPVSAAAVVFFCLTSGSAQGWARLHGIMSIALPLFLPLITGEILNASAPDYIETLLSSTGNGGFGIMPGIGLVAIVLLGAIQIFVSFQRHHGPTEKITS